MSRTLNEPAAANASAAAKASLDALYAPIKSELAEVEKILRAELRSDFPFVDELVRYSCLLGGKRLRPILLLLSGKAVGALNHDHLVLAAVVEMIHTATLVHDDILDEAVLRRHLATVNSRWDNETSVLLGDYLFTHSFYLASTLETTLACRWIGRATNIVCEGEIRQVGNCGNYEISEREYLQIIESKTAELCACSCRLGAHFAGATPQDVERMDNYGRQVGIAFQIADDLLDVLGDEEKTGKSLGADLNKQKPTLPLIHVLEKAGPEDRRKILEILQSDSRTKEIQLADYFDRFGALDYARAKAISFANQAQQQIDPLPESPAKDILSAITRFVVNRSR